MITLMRKARDTVCPDCGAAASRKCRNSDGAALSIMHKDRLNKASADPEVIQACALNMGSNKFHRSRS